MSTFSDDKAFDKFKNETEAFSSSKKADNTRNRSQDHAFKGKTPEIVNQYGYNIVNPKDNRTEQKKYDKQNLEPNDTENNSYVSNKKEAKTPHLHNAPLLQTHTKYTQRDSSLQKDEFIHFDFEDKSEKYVFRDETPFAHGKTAKKTYTTDAGGGAKIAASFDKKGQVKSKITLNKGGERTDTKGFINKLVLFGDKAENAHDYFKSDENEALASFADEKAETIFLHNAKDHLRTSYRYKDIRKETKKDIKQLKKELQEEKKEETDKKKEKAEASRNVEDYFKQTNGQFSDDRHPFVVPIEQKFGERGLKSREEILFISKEEENGQTVPAMEKNKQHQPQSQSKFEPDNPMTRQEKLEQSRSQYKAAKKGERKEVKKAATRTAVAKMLESKKDLQNQIGDLSGQTSGDLLKDGSAGLLTTVINTFKQSATHIEKKLGLSMLKVLSSLLIPLLIPICFVFLIITITMSTFAAVGGLLGSDGGDETYDNVDVTGDGYVYSNLTDDQIEDIMQALYDNYDDFNSDQEQVLRYALTKVGCAYDQEYHGNCNVNIFDCSSLAYRSYRSIGVNISNNGAYSAAEECHAMMNAGKTVTGDLKPGDLIFYGNSNNGRYMGIYHVAIYVGRVNGVDKMVEARGTKWGVVYGDVRTSNIVNISRPL